jgi:hypothetical protein
MMYSSEICIHVREFSVRLYARTYKHEYAIPQTWSFQTFMCSYIYIQTYVYANIYLYIYLSIYIYIYIYLYIYICLYVQLFCSIFRLIYLTVGNTALA